MKDEIRKLFDGNRRWSEKIRESNPQFFSQLAKEQTPDYLWIGCSDSRVPPNEIMGLAPGEVFVHRNVANVVEHSDLNCLSVIQFAVDVLKVRHIIVAGHYSCGGISAALTTEKYGLIDNWLSHLKSVYHLHQEEVDALPEGPERVNRLCELNVKYQVSQVCSTRIVQDAWSRGQALAIHGWIYGLSDGLLKDLKVSVTGNELESPRSHLHLNGR